MPWLSVSRCHHGLGDAQEPALGLDPWVLAWRLSNTLEADFCAEALNEVLARFGPPDIMNTDQGSQFTSWAWTNRLRQAGVIISMDGNGRFLDNIFVERL